MESRGQLDLLEQPLPPGSVSITVPWPRYPTVTPSGLPSGSKHAGHLVPWLSMNNVGRMNPVVFRDAKERWNIEGYRAGLALVQRGEAAPTGAVLVLHAELVKARANPMDAFAVLEGVKPAIDGIVAAEWLYDDNTDFLAGGTAASRAVRDGEEPHLVLSFRTRSMEPHRTPGGGCNVCTVGPGCDQPCARYLT